jgi:hypothetical protein
MNHFISFPKNYFQINYFPSLYFQIKKDKVVVDIPSGGSVSLGPYTPAYDISKEDLFDVIKVKTGNDTLQLLIGKALGKIYHNDDEEVLLTLINYTLLNESEEKTIELVQLVIELIEAIEEEEKNLRDEDEKVLELILENLFIRRKNITF